jgi:hypothetical protein
MDERLFGTLHTPVKSSNYSGSQTDTVTVEVDNKQRIIKAYLTRDVLQKIADSHIKIDELQVQLNGLYDHIQILSNELERIQTDINMEINVLTQNLEILGQSIPRAVSELSNDSGFITEEALVNYATQDYVDEKISEIDISGEDIDLSAYYTSTEVDALIEDFATEEYVDKAVENVAGFDPTVINEQLMALRTDIDVFKTIDIVDPNTLI